MIRCVVPPSLHKNSSHNLWLLRCGTSISRAPGFICSQNVLKLNKWDLTSPFCRLWCPSSLFAPTQITHHDRCGQYLFMFGSWASYASLMPACQVDACFSSSVSRFNLRMFCSHRSFRTPRPTFFDFDFHYCEKAQFGDTEPSCVLHYLVITVT